MVEARDNRQMDLRRWKEKCDEGGVEENKEGMGAWIYRRGDNA